MTIILCMIDPYLPIFCIAAESGWQKGQTDMKISKEYLLLFNAITDAEETLTQLREELVAAQRQAEDLFLGEREPREEK